VEGVVAAQMEEAGTSWTLSTSSRHATGHIGLWESVLAGYRTYAMRDRRC
jgi:hypothetical protein